MISLEAMHYLTRNKPEVIKSLWELLSMDVECWPDTFNGQLSGTFFTVIRDMLTSTDQAFGWKQVIEFPYKTDDVSDEVVSCYREAGLDNNPYYSRLYNEVDVKQAFQYIEELFDIKDVSEYLAGELLEVYKKILDLSYEDAVTINATLIQEVSGKSIKMPLCFIEISLSSIYGYFDDVKGSWKMKDPKYKAVIYKLFNISNEESGVSGLDSLSALAGAKQLYPIL